MLYIKQLAFTQSFKKQLFNHPVWLMVASFGTYFCMYGFRKPFTAAMFLQNSAGLVEFKSYLIFAQVIGYMLAKWLGIRFISSIESKKRLIALVAMIAAATLALFAFSILPYPLNVGCLFFNGLALGGVFGLVLSFLEGRRNSEFLISFLCASFILADGFSKTIGTWLLNNGIPELQMPFVASLIFSVPFLFFTYMLSLTASPTNEDLLHRKQRMPMDKNGRKAFIATWFWALLGVVLTYLAVTLLRSLRADFAPEIWSALGYKSKPSLFINTELYVSLGVVLVSAMTHYFKQHWRALFFSLFYCLLGFLIGLFSLLALQFHLINPFVFMILLGIGLYLPYVAIHNTVFERILSISTVPGNIGFLMYWADSIGYAGYMILIAFQFFSGYSLGEWTTLIHLFWIFGAMGLLMIICSIFVLNQKYRHGER